MTTLIVFVAILACAWSAPCVHNNHADLTEEHVINMVIEAADFNDDGVLDDLDLANFLTRYDANNNYKVEKVEFANGWVSYYHDERAFAEHVFDFLNTDTDNVLEADDIPALVARADTSGDGKVQVSEMRIFLENIYNAC
ncbi:hypothetical protein SNE40_006930 [Patella caerulea]|uniref:Calmodulin n=1 Tax=Patella caerulea TaxID=87958 RepID=A0AAN8JXJ3_PATCE